MSILGEMSRMGDAPYDAYTRFAERGYTMPEDVPNYQLNSAPVFDQPERLGSAVTLYTERNSRGTNVSITVRSHATQADVDNTLHLYLRTLMGYERIVDASTSYEGLRQLEEEASEQA